MNEAAPRAAPTRAQPRDAALPGRGESPVRDHSGRPDL